MFVVFTVCILGYQQQLAKSAICNEKHIHKNTADYFKKQISCQQFCTFTNGHM